eukprot:tig00020780_g13793.t1
MRRRCLPAADSLHTHLESRPDNPRDTLEVTPELTPTSAEAVQAQDDASFAVEDVSAASKLQAEKTNRPPRHIEIMDTTLRDGEQTHAVSFSGSEKLFLAKFLLERLGVDRVEIASARVSPQEQRAVTSVLQWAEKAGFQRRVEMLGFCDHTASPDWIYEAGGRTINLLTKGSRRHCERQLRKTPREHLDDIARTVEHAVEKRGMDVNVYLEDWSYGFLHENDYVREMVDELVKLPIRRVILPDTLGIMEPEEVRAGVADIMARHPLLFLEFHGHNDYGLAVANALQAVKAGARGVHATLNGLGERTGNTCLETLVTCLQDKLGMHTGVDDKELVHACQLVEAFSGRRIPHNAPIVGKDVYTHTAGIHADGDKKGGLYSSDLAPERFGRDRVFALGKLAGKASLSLNLAELGISLDADQEKRLLERIKELGGQKHTVTAGDLPQIIHELFGLGSKDFVVMHNVSVTSVLAGESVASIEVGYRGKRYRVEAGGVGGFAAYINALGSFAGCLGVAFPKPVAYEVRVLEVDAEGADAVVEVQVTWQLAGGKRRITAGSDRDQLMAGVRAAEKMMNQLLRSLDEEGAPEGGAADDDEGHACLLGIQL